MIRDPGELGFVGGEIGIERDEKAVSVAERVTRKSIEATMRAVWWNELRNGLKIIGQAFVALGVADVLRGSDVVIAGREKIRNAAFGGDAIDERHETFVPLFRIAAVDDGVASLKDESNRIRRYGKFFDVREHRINDEGMFVLNFLAVAAAARVAVNDEGELIDVN